MLISWPSWPPMLADADQLAELAADAAQLAELAADADQLAELAELAADAGRAGRRC